MKKYKNLKFFKTKEHGQEFSKIKHSRTNVAIGVTKMKKNLKKKKKFNLVWIGAGCQIGKLMMMVNCMI